MSNSAFAIGCLLLESKNLKFEEKSIWNIVVNFNIVVNNNLNQLFQCTIYRTRLKMNFNPWPRAKANKASFFQMLLLHFTEFFEAIWHNFVISTNTFFKNAYIMLWNTLNTKVWNCNQDWTCVSCMV